MDWRLIMGNALFARSAEAQLTCSAAGCACSRKRRQEPRSAALTTPRRLMLCGLFTGLLTLGAGLWLLWPRSAITREKAGKIQEGMTPHEVEAIFGGPELGSAA